VESCRAASLAGNAAKDGFRLGRFISAAIPLAVYRALGTQNGSETIDGGSY
jgi:hypothetical protein